MKTSNSSPTITVQNIHAVSIGRTGAAYMEALVRTGEIEDLLAIEGATFSALMLDIGDDDTLVPSDYARSLKTRLISRGIDPTRFHYESINLSIPEKSALGTIPKGAKLPKAGDHIPRSIAKAVFGAHAPDIAGAIDRFTENVRKSKFDSTVFVAFGMAGGTGSGTAVGIAEQLRSRLNANAQIVGIGQLSHSGDGSYYNNATQYQALEAVDAAISAPKKVFDGGFFSAEQSWQRLSAYTSTGLKEVRQRFKQMVTNRFVADSFMRWALSSDSSHLLRSLKQGEGACTIFDVAKLSHPGVQVLPGEAGSKWKAVLSQWIQFVPKYSGLVEAFKTDYAEVHVYASRNMQVELIEEALVKVVSSSYLRKGSKSIVTGTNEFFDVLTAYGNIVMPGANRQHLTSYAASKASFDSLDKAAQQLELS
jgi:hypothetical protein